MCGIVGCYGDFSQLSLSRANDAQVHRGPDDFGQYYDEMMNVGLAHRRLSVIDTSQCGHQPMCNNGESVVLVYNGEIYNYRELRSELRSRSYDFFGHSDTEVIMNLYIADGLDMLAKIKGIFAFALWDRNHKRLLLARDGLGVKPLYYSETEKGFAFASEIKGLLKLLINKVELNYESLHQYLTYLWCPGESTLINGVKKLLPGEAMIVTDGRVTRRWSWYELPVFNKEKQCRIGVNEAVKGVTASLRNAVQKQMVADVPVGAFLSGGLDSSAIVAFAKDIEPDIRCFTIKSTGSKGEGFSDDLPYAKQVAKHLSVGLDVVEINAEKIASDIMDMVPQLDEPLADLAPLSVGYICRLAKNNGIKVMLSGVGGDDLFAGYRRHRSLTYDKYIELLPISMRRQLFEISSRLNQKRPEFRRISKFLSGAELAGNKRIVNYFAWSQDCDLLSLYSKDVREKIYRSKAENPMLEFISLMPKNKTPLERMLGLEQRFFLGDHNLIYTDKMSMAHGVEVRVPFLDNELMDYAQKIPDNYKLRRGHGKWILKKAMEPYLPANVIYRGKTGFGPPLRSLMKNELKELFDELLSERKIAERGLFDYKAVSRLMDLNRVGKVNADYTLLSLLCVEIWCRAYLD